MTKKDLYEIFEEGKVALISLNGSPTVVVGNKQEDFGNLFVKPYTDDDPDNMDSIVVVEISIFGVKEAYGADIEGVLEAEQNAKNDGVDVEIEALKGEDIFGEVE